MNIKLHLSFTVFLPNNWIVNCRGSEKIQAKRFAWEFSTNIENQLEP